METIFHLLFGCREIRDGLQKEVTEMRNKFDGYGPGLAIVQVGDRPDSNVYIRMKIKAAAEIGIKCVHHSLPSSSTQMQVTSPSQLLLNRTARILYSVHGEKAESESLVYESKNLQIRAWKYRNIPLKFNVLFCINTYNDI